MLDHSRQLTLRAWYGTTSLSRLSACLRIPPDQVLAEADRLGLRPPTKATLTAIAANEQKEQKAYRKRNLAEMAEAARVRSELRVKQKAEEKTAAEKKKAARVQRDAEMEQRDAAICEEYPDTENHVLAKRWKLTAKRIASIALERGVRKSPEFIRQKYKVNGYKSASCYKTKVAALRAATDLLKAGDHVAALNVLEAAL